MKKNELKFVMDTNWIFDGVIDAEQKQYVLLGFFQKMNKNLEEMKLYPMFTEITLHLANIQNIMKNGEMIYSEKKLKSFDDELTITDLKSKPIPILNEKEKTELKNILAYSLAKLKDYFDILKSLWTIVYDSIEIISIINEENIGSTKGYFTTKSSKIINIWEYNIRKYKGDKKMFVTENHDVNFTFLSSNENKLPVFNLHISKETPMEETLFPLMKRKVTSFVLQTKNLAIR